MRKSNFIWMQWVLLPLLLVMIFSHAYGVTPAGYTEYYIPGDEDSLMFILDTIGANDQTTDDMHSEVAITAWTANTTIYYDHWEDGYDFDPDDPLTADETYLLANSGDIQIFTGNDIPLPRTAVADCGTSTCYYDGRDYVYIAGGFTTVSRAGWTDQAGTLLAVAWELYPVRPQLIKYILPIGEDLAANTPPDLQDFERVFALVQATEDNTVVTVDIDGDGAPDNLDTDGDSVCDGVTSVILNRGDILRLGSDADCISSLDTGTVILGTETLQVQYIIGDEGSDYEIRGFSAFPRGFWDDEYYAPVDGADPANNDPTDLYIHNPHTTDLTIQYQSRTVTGSFTIPPRNLANGDYGTVSFEAVTGSYVPQDSALYLKGSDVFWGISTIDTSGNDSALQVGETHDWGYSLVPATLLDQEHYMGWAPGSFPAGTGGAADNSGVFITPAADNTRIFVDFNHDGVADQTYDLNRLETVFVYDSTDGDMSNAAIWATGPFSSAYGQNPESSPPAVPAIDVGYTILPGKDYIDLVLRVVKTADPVVVPTAAGQQSTFTLVIDSVKYDVDDLNVTDSLPPGWQYVDDSTTITLTDKTQVSGDPADPAVSSSLQFLDTFSSQAYNNNDGTDSWATAWIENNDVPNGSPTTGNITITAGTLQLDDNPNSGGLPSIEREADLTGITTATLTFDYSTSAGVDTSDSIQLHVSNNGGSTWTLLNDFTGIAGATSGSGSYDISSYIAADTRIRFIVNNLYGGTNETFSVDNVQIATPQGGLLWPDTLLGSMAPNQQIIITFIAETTTDFSVGDVSRNYVEAVGTRTIIGPTGTVTQTFTATDFVFISYGDIQVEKTTSGVDPLYPGDQFTYTVTVTNPVTATSDLTGIGIYDPLPEGVSYVAGSSFVVAPTTTITLNVADLFNTQAYNNNDGSASWASDWIEINDNGSPSSGDFLITGGELMMDNDTAGGLPSISRQVNLTGAATATLSFDWEIPFDNIDPSDSIVIEEYNGVGWDILEDFTGYTLATSGSRSYALSYFAADSQIRFRINNAYGAFQEHFLVDNLDITFEASSGGAGPAGDPPNFLSSGDNYVLAPGETLTLTFDVTVDDPLATGIDEIINTACVTTGEIFAPVCDDASNIVINPSTDSASVGDRVWFDTDGDGVQDIGEPVLANVEVTLKDQFGAPIATTTTDSIGNYLFLDVEPGDGYYVEVTDGLPEFNPEITRVDTIADVGGSLGGTYFLLNAPGTEYYVWFDVDNGNTDPAVAGRTGIEVDITSGASADAVASAIQAALDAQADFSAMVAADVVTITNAADGHVIDAADNDTGFTISTFQQGTLGFEQTYPAGHSDDRTDPFDLIAGQSYLDADLGYTSPPGTATIGDLVWSDYDGNGSRDAGEPGLAGITVELYLDDGDGIFEPGTDDSLVTSTTTAADGSYLFTGITAGGTEDYTAHVDQTQTALSGYTPTTSTQLLNVDVDAGDILLINDFGFQNTTTTYTIKDRVWFDANKDEEDDGESGISGVIVDLLDTSLNVIATVITDADGYFIFSGVIGGGADYTVRISDNNGVLDDYFGTTAEALAGEMAIDNLNSNLDFTVEPDEPNFGYSLSGSIGDTVFNDLGGTDGLQDPGEPGIGGVTVDLYLDDGDGIFEPGGDDAFVATQTTNSSGIYLFSGLDDGTYFVDIDETQSVLSSYDTLTTSDDDGAAGHQREVTITGSSSYVDADYGYRVTTDPRAVSGTVWNDNDKDGVIDGTETFFENVTIELLQGGTVVIVTSTDANGDYSFSGLPAGTYTVRITDDIGVLSGYTTTYEITEGITAPFNDQEVVDLSSSDQTGINFGYMKPAPTLAVISSFSAYEDRGKVVVLWETASEIGTAGFYLYRKDGSTGEYSRINKKLLVGLLHSPQGGTYRYTDRTAFPGDTYTYKLTEIEFNGTTRDYGPFTVNTGTIDPDGAPEEPVDYEYTKKAKKSSSGRKDRTRPQTSPSLKSITNTADKAKIAVAADGLYYLDASDIADVLGADRQSIVNAIKSNMLVITNRGNNVAILPSDGDNGIYFYGEGTDSIYTDRNVYLLTKGRKNQGTRMETVEGTGPAPASGDETFREDVHTEEDHWPLTDIFDDPEVDYWLWDYIIAVDPDDISEDDEKYSLTFTIHTDGAANIPDNAYLTVHLKGYTDTAANPDHHVSVTLNNEELTTLNGIEVKRDWNGTDEPPLTFDFTQILLNDVENTVTVTGLLEDGVDYSIFYVDSFDLTYQRHYQAVNNRLIIRGDGNPVVTVGGFTGEEILVFDVSDANMPELINATTIDESSGSYRVSFVPVSPDTEYLVISTDAVISGLDIRADIESRLKNKNNAADYVLITSPELREAAETLLDYRQGQGYSTMLVEVEDIMDEFSFGISHPEAIKDFLSYAYHKWKTPPMYVLLAGAGNYDYRDNNGYGGNIIPPIMVSTPDGLFASDNRFADVVGNDGVPEIAIGRLPVLTPEELLTYKEKVETYEMHYDEPWERRVIMLADDPDAGGNFDLDSDAVAEIIPVSYTAEKIYLTNNNFNAARQSLHDALDSGAAFLNYIGHGGLDRIGLDPITYKGLLQTDDVASLNNVGKLPVISAMTCVVGQFAIAGYDSLGESLIVQGNGGAVALWSPTGLSFNDLAGIMNEEYFRAVFVSGETVLGDALLKTLQGYDGRSGNKFMLDIYNLLGDPALRLK